jgi:glycoside/pentoside/hexuronide:cation symporter, GPH family
MHKPSGTSTAPGFGWRDGWRYGLMGFPLAFVALPLYVVLPNHYARTFGVPLATLGAVLLAARLLDAVIDPLLGRWSDALFARSTQARAALGCRRLRAAGRGLCAVVFSTRARCGCAG